MQPSAKKIISDAIKTSLAIMIQSYYIVGLRAGKKSVRVKIRLSELQQAVKERIESTYGTPGSRLAARALFGFFSLLPKRLQKKIEEFADACNPEPYYPDEAYDEPEIPRAVLAALIPPTTRALREEWLPPLLPLYPNAVLTEDTLEFDADIPPSRFAHVR